MLRHGPALVLLAMLLQVSCALGSVVGSRSYMENAILRLGEKTNDLKPEEKLKEQPAYFGVALFRPADRTSDVEAVNHKDYLPGTKKGVGHVETSPAVYDKGIIKIVHKGWFVMQWEITWEESTVKKAWDGNDKDITAPYSREIEIPHNAQAIHVVAWECTGWPFQWWRVVLDRTDIPFLPERTFTVWGTTGYPQYNIDPPLKMF